MSEDSIEWFDVDGRIARRAASLLGLPQVPIKALSKNDSEQILDHMLSLGSEDRRLRFGNRLSDTGVIRYIDSIDHEKDALFGVFDQNRRLRAFCHLAILEYQGLKAGELGLSVDPEFRGHGIGSILFARATNHARVEGIERIFIHCLMENESMLKIAFKAGMEVESGQGECEAHLCLPPSGAGAVIREFMHEQMAVFDTMFKRQIHRVKDWAEWTGDKTSAIVTTVADLPGNIVNTVSEIPGAIGHALEKIPDAISSTVSSTVDMLPDVITETAKMVPDALNSTAEMVSPMTFLASSKKGESDIDRMIREMPPPTEAPTEKNP